MNQIECVVQEHHKAVEARRDRVIAAPIARLCPPIANYAWPKLESLLAETDCKVVEAAERANPPYLVLINTLSMCHVNYLESI